MERRWTNPRRWLHNRRIGAGSLLRQRHAGTARIGSPLPAIADPLRRIGLQPQLPRSEEHTTELQSLMRISYAVFCLKKKKERQNSHKQSKLHETEKYRITQ